MRARSSLFLAATFLLVLPLSACGGKAIPEDLETRNVIEDKCRNWYEIFVASYYDSDGDGIGDLNGVKAKLDYIKDTGYNGIWLMPVFSSPTYHKYNASDYYEIDEDYGDPDPMKDLKGLIDAAHGKNVRVILDLVLNHCSKKNSLYKESWNAHKKERDGAALDPREEEVKDLFSWRDNADGSFGVEHNFDEDMPEFNFDSAYAKTYFEEVIRYYLVDVGADGFRLDAVPYLYLGNMAKNFEVLNHFYDYAKGIKPDVYFVGECWDSKNVIEKYYENTHLDSYFWFPGSTKGGRAIIDSLNRNGEELAQYSNCLKDMTESVHGHIAAPFIDNHDMPRATRVDEEKAKFQLGLLAMMSGGTFNYYGDELNMKGADGAGDPGYRTPFPWKSGTGYEGFTGRGPETGYLAQEQPSGSLEEQLKDKSSVYNYERKALLLRNQIPGIARGELKEVKPEPDASHLLVTKTYEDKDITIIFNFAADADWIYPLAGDSRKVAGQLTARKDSRILMNKDGGIVLPPHAIAVIA